MMILCLLKNSVKKYLLYPSYFIGEITGSILFPIIINSSFILAIISSNDINSYSYNEIIFYIVISNLTYIVTHIDVANVIAKDIKGNGLGKQILMPRYYFSVIICKAIAQILVRILFIYIPIFFIFSLLLGSSTTFIRLIYSVPFLMISGLINIMISIIIGLSAFYFTEIWGLKSIFNFFSYTLSGSLFPFDIIGESVQKVVLLTPFPYLSYISTKIITDSNYLIDKSMYLLPSLYIILFLLIIKLLWKYGINKYQSCGV